MDEWNYWYGPYVYGELGVQYHLKDALGIARGLHAFFRNSDIYFMANYAQTVNVIGAIKTSRTDATFDTTGLVLALYRAQFGSIPVSVSGSPGKLDVSAALTDDGKALTVAVVNPQASADEAPSGRSVGRAFGTGNPLGPDRREPHELQPSRANRQGSPSRRAICPGPPPARSRCPPTRCVSTGSS